MSCKFNPLYYMIVLLVLILTACASAPQSTATSAPLAVESAPETDEAPADKVEEQTTETAVATPTIEATATLTPYQVWEATCLTEGAEYVDVPFGPQEDGGMGIQALS